jgi:hypothetical protein
MDSVNVVAVELVLVSAGDGGWGRDRRHGSPDRGLLRVLRLSDLEHVAYGGSALAHTSNRARLNTFDIPTWFLSAAHPYVAHV